MEDEAKAMEACMERWDSNAVKLKKCREDGVGGGGDFMLGVMEDLGNVRGWNLLV